MFAEQMKLGVPMGFQNIITAVGGLAVQSVVNGFGMLFLAGYTAANRLYGLLETAASSYGYAISTYTAQNAGAGRNDRIRSGIRAELVIGTVSASFSGARPYSKERRTAAKAACHKRLPGFRVQAPLQTVYPIKYW